MEDPFDSAINLEDQHIQEGYLKGIENGRKEGFKEGRDLGVVKGFEIASEVGFYRGCTQAWRHLQRLAPSDIPARADKAITAMEVILDSFPLRDPRNEHIHDAVEDLRAKHKAVTAMLSHKASGGPSRTAGPALDFLEF